MARNLPSEMLYRIVVGNNLLSTAGTTSPNADPLVVAQTVLLAHDASELILAALVSTTGITYRAKDKKFLINYVEDLEDKKNIEGKIFFNELNDARVAFKHSGILPTSLQFHDCIDKAKGYLNKACVKCIGKSLDEIDLTMLIENTEARKLYEQSKQLCKEKKMQQVLETLGLCFRRVLDDTPYQYIVEIGIPESEAALHLLGCGVDPSSFLSMQKLLPEINSLGEIKWNFRATGHPGNWSQDNIDYCMKTLLKIILQIQHAMFTAPAVPFNLIFEDVLIANRNGVSVYIEDGGAYAMLGTKPDRRYFGELNNEQKIYGQLTPAMEIPPRGNWRETSIEFANILIVHNPKIEIIGNFEISDFSNLLVKPEDVEISHRLIDNQWVRERFPHLF